MRLVLLEQVGGPLLAGEVGVLGLAKEVEVVVLHQMEEGVEVGEFLQEQVEVEEVEFHWEHGEVEEEEVVELH